MQGVATEMIASRRPRVGEMQAYERVLGDAMAGDSSIFARQDYVDEAWRIVDPILDQATPVSVYEPGTWGPPDPDKKAVPPGGWHDPILPDEEVIKVVPPKKQ